MDRYLLANVPAIISLQKMESATVKHRVQTAISRIETASLDHYDYISIISIYWASDDTGGKEDSSLFITTVSKLGNAETTMKTKARAIANEEKVHRLLSEILEQAESMTGRRKLFILHYAGHAIAAGTSNSLIITSTIDGDDDKTSNLNMTLIKDALKDLASTSVGLDVLLVLDCCCAAVAGRGRVTSGERVELMAATSGGGISNSRKDGKTFTQHWCLAFDKFLERGQPFCCNDIETTINSNFTLEQYPATFVLREGWGVPVTFRALPSSTTLIPSALTGQTVITALHIAENPGSESMERLIDYLQNAPVQITVLATLPISSTLLLLRVPVYLQEMLVLPRVSYLIDV
jgi:hypothetical protein